MWKEGSKLFKILRYTQRDIKYENLVFSQKTSKNPVPAGYWVTDKLILTKTVDIILRNSEKLLIKCDKKLDNDYSFFDLRVFKLTDKEMLITDAELSCKANFRSIEQKIFFKLYQEPIGKRYTVYPLWVYVRIFL